MLGVIGFVVAAAAIGTFVWSVKAAYSRLDSQTTHLFTTAFSILALVMVVCGLAVMPNLDSDIRPFILAVDVMLLAATACLLGILLDLRSPILLSMLAAIMGLIIAARVFLFPTEAYVEDGILYFNLTGVARTALTAIILGVWLPATIVVARRAARTVAVAGLGNVLASAYFLLAAITAIFFATARREVIIATFVVLTITFIGLSAINVQVSRLGKLAVRKETKHAKRSK